MKSSKSVLNFIANPQKKRVSSIHTILRFTVLSLVMITLAREAQAEDWASEPTKFVDGLNVGFKQIAQGIAVASVILFIIISMATQRFNMMWLITIVLGAGALGFGPTMLEGLISLGGGS